MSEQVVCRGTNRRGEPCSASPQANGWCFFHNPAKKAERRAAKAKGGRARHGRKVTDPSTNTTVRLRSVEDVLTYLEQIAGNLGHLENSVSRARAQAYVAQQVLGAIVDHELEQRLEALEEAIRGKQAA